MKERKRVRCTCCVSGMCATRALWCVNWHKGGPRREGADQSHVVRAEAPHGSVESTSIGCCLGLTLNCAGIKRRTSIQRAASWSRVWLTSQGKVRKVHAIRPRGTRLWSTRGHEAQEAAGGKMTRSFNNRRRSNRQEAAGGKMTRSFNNRRRSNRGRLRRLSR